MNNSTNKTEGKLTTIPADYGQLLEDLKIRIRQAQTRAVLAVNRELILLYWHIGREILSRQQQAGWGAKIIDRLAADLRRAFPEMKGFSRTNLLYMRAFAEAYPNESIVQQLAGQIPWGHNVILIDRVKDTAEREWYLRATLEYGWSRAVLITQIETGLYRRQGRAITNFERALPPPQSDLAQQTFKDPYVFDFLTLSKEAREQELEQGLLDHVQRFLLELGVGFAFVGRQVHLGVGDQDFYLDLLFYHLRLRCYVVIDLKAVPFQPEFAGKMNFYLSAVDDLLRHPDDRPSIGLLLCKEKNRLIVEYALRDLNKPIGVAAWETRLVESLPEEWKGSLPTVEELEAELGTGTTR
jgi:predicted nuclease of restriction endonuclease-like (RecB) superfamily